MYREQKIYIKRHHKIYRDFCGKWRLKFANNYHELFCHDTHNEYLYAGKTSYLVVMN